jgi:predicted ATPase
MPGYILTGAPGSGKTAVLRQLELNGHTVVEEAATDVIALRQALSHPRPWEEPGFIDDIVALQQRRQLGAEANPQAHGVTFFDRSPICTLALSRYADLAPSRYLLDEVARTMSEGHYQRRVRLLWSEPGRALAR